MLSKVKIILKTFGDHPGDTPPGVPMRAFPETFRWGGKSQSEYMQWHLVGWAKGESKPAFILHLSLYPDCGCNVIDHLMFRLPSLLCHDGLCPPILWTLLPLSPFLPLSLPLFLPTVSYFVTAAGEAAPTMTGFALQAEMTGSYWFTVGYVAHG